MPSNEAPKPTNQETGIEVPSQESLEVLSPEIDELSKRTSLDLEAIDRYCDGDSDLPEKSTPTLDRFRKSVEGLKNKTPQELLSLVDPQNILKQSDFSSFSIKENPPGCIHVELGNSADLQRFRSAFQGRVGEILQSMFGDTREIDSFGAQYFNKDMFSSGNANYLGVIVSVRSEAGNEEQTKGILKHEYSHAIMHEVIRPTCHYQIADVKTHASVSQNIRSLENVGKDTLAKLARHLDVMPDPETPQHLATLQIAKNLQEEQNLLDELRAYTFNSGFFAPKRQITNLNFEDYDNVNGASSSIAKKYFEVFILHTYARLVSEKTERKSLSILGSCLSLTQARRLLEQALIDVEFDSNEGEEIFLSRLHAVLEIISSNEFIDFTDDQKNELTPLAEARSKIIPRKYIVDKQIKSRWGSFEDSPLQFQSDYKAIYSNS